VLVATACVLGSARLWSDALTPAAVPFVEPLVSGGGRPNAAPPTVVIATAAPLVRHAAPKVVRKPHAKAVAPAVAIPRVKVSAPAPAQAAAASAPQTPPKTAPPPVQPPKAKPPVAPPATAPQPSPPAPVAPSAPVVQIAAASPPAPPATPPVEPPAQQSDSRPGHGYGDKNHTHSGPPGQQGS
jgi:hypothetical protein